tara:strand:+ start:2972 stop:3568 length:597 start_codon:yes stop_codon:yes gene_type:complete
MTRTFNEKIRCTKCGNEDTVETDFERWMRQSELLDSKKGLVRFDLDILLHRYKFEVDGKGDRDIQCMMFVEVKTFMATPSPAQRDTLSMLNQVLRNRRVNINSRHRKQVADQPSRVESKLLNRDVCLRLYGGHLLQIDGSSPVNSSLMLWDNIPISSDQLIDLLLFVRNPDKPELLIDHRRRYRSWTNAPMLNFGDPE